MHADNMYFATPYRLESPVMIPPTGVEPKDFLKT